MYYSDYNNRPDPNEPIETTAYRVEAAETMGGKPKKKKHMGAKITALCLSCARLGGFAGSGAMLAFGGGGGGSTTVYEGDHAPTIVNVSNVTQSEPLSAAQIYATYVGSTVGITTEITTTNIFGQTVQNAASGSGFVITSDGYIVTNWHVIDEASNIKVTFIDGKSYDAKLVGGDEENDIAVLKIDAAGLTPVVIGSSDALVVGDQVYAIGNPLGELTYSMTGGIVSALNRNVTMSDGRRMNYVQTDTAINSGNSGGALFNQYGQVVGIVSAKLSSSGSGSSASVEGLGFAIPIDDVKSMITDIIEHGYITGRPYLGIVGQSVSGEAVRYGTPAGTYVMGVVEGSGAAKAGIQKEDIITRIDDKEITSMDDLQNAQKDYKAGDTAVFTLYRDGEKTQVTVTFSERNSEMEAAGSALQEQINQELQEQYQQQYQQQQQQQSGGYWPFGW